MTVAQETSMLDLFPPWPLSMAFFAASCLLAVTPGPGVFYIVARTLAEGRRSGFASVAGVASGNLGNALGAAIGLAALFAFSSTAFVIVKYAGALYLVYLGIRTLCRRLPDAPANNFRPADPWRIFRDGFIVALLNPKTAVFFAAFLPQFMTADAAPMLQSVTLGTMFVAIAAVTDIAYVVAAGAVSPLLMRAQGIEALGRYLTGGAFIGMGVFAAFAGPRSARP
jgi:threonine/homoserine/homoserine lactone efflux protein